MRFYLVASNVKKLQVPFLVMTIAAFYQINIFDTI